MGANLVNNLQAAQEFDLQHKNPGDAWGDNKLSTHDWDQLEESAACLTPAAKVSKFMEGDKHLTSSLIVPMTCLLMKRCSDDHDVHFENRQADKFND